MKILQYAIVMLCVVTLGGCGKGNPNAPASVDPVTKKAHPDPNWLATTHKKTKATEIPNCAECHGGDFKGGIVNVACIKCHPNGPQGGPPHAIDGTFILPPPAQHGIEAKKSLALCGGCHGNGTNQPFTTLSILGNPKGCETCHSNPTDPTRHLAHPYGWIPGRGASTTTSHATAGDLALSCGLCHGAALDGVGGIAPSCMSASVTIAGVAVGCHSNGSPLVNTGCTSCHGAPPAGTVAPNRAYRHAPHFSATANLAGLACSACHSGSGSGTINHATRTVFSPMTAPTAIDPKFFQDINGAVVAARYNPPGNAGKCENVSCHGGKITPFPIWKSATALLVNDGNRCAFICHTISTVPPATYTGPYIGPFSGPNTPSLGNLHNYHANALGSVLLCAKCHKTPGTEHWANIMLGRRTLAPGFAAGTVGGAGTSVLTYSYDSITGTSSCTTALGCHSSAPRSWY